MSQIPAAHRAQNMPYMRISGESSNTSRSTMPLRMVSVTPRPSSRAPRNCKIECGMAASKRTLRPMINSQTNLAGPIAARRQAPGHCPILRRAVYLQLLMCLRELDGGISVCIVKGSLAETYLEDACQNAGLEEREGLGSYGCCKSVRYIVSTNAIGHEESHQGTCVATLYCQRGVYKHIHSSQTARCELRKPAYSHSHNNTAEGFVGVLGRVLLSGMWLSASAKGFAMVPHASIRFLGFVASLRNICSEGPVAQQEELTSAPSCVVGCVYSKHTFAACIDPLLLAG